MYKASKSILPLLRNNFFLPVLTNYFVRVTLIISCFILSSSPIMLSGPGDWLCFSLFVAFLSSLIVGGSFFFRYSSVLSIFFSYSSPDSWVISTLIIFGSVNKLWKYCLHGSWSQMVHSGSTEYYLYKQANCLKFFLISFMNRCNILLSVHVVLFYVFVSICWWTALWISHVPLLLHSSYKPLVPTAASVRISFPTLAFMLPNIIFILYEGHCFYVLSSTS
jgi:hypothetical protein